MHHHDIHLYIHAPAFTQPTRGRVAGHGHFGLEGAVHLGHGVDPLPGVVHGLARVRRPSVEGCVECRGLWRREGETGSKSAAVYSIRRTLEDGRHDAMAGASDLYVHVRGDC